MKRCRSCGIEYPDRYYECQTCGEELVEFKAKKASNEHGSEYDNYRNHRAEESTSGAYTVQENERNSSFSYQRIVPESGVNRRNELAQETSAIEFERHGPINSSFNGIVSQINTFQNRQSVFGKLMHTLFTGEPYQFGPIAYTTIFRVEEMATNRFAERARDVVIYGNIQSLLALGDDVTVTAVRRGDRYIAKRIYSNTTDSLVRVPHEMSAGVVRFMALVLVGLIAMIIVGITTADYSQIGQFFSKILDKLFVLIIVVVIIWYCIKNLFRRR